MVKHGYYPCYIIVKRYDVFLNLSTESHQSCYENDIKRRCSKIFHTKLNIYFICVSCDILCSWKNSWILLVSWQQVWVRGDLVLWKAPREVVLKFQTYTYWSEAKLVQTNSQQKMFGVIFQSLIFVCYFFPGKTAGSCWFLGGKYCYGVSRECSCLLLCEELQRKTSETQITEHLREWVGVEAGWVVAHCCKIFPCYLHVQGGDGADVNHSVRCY